VNRVLFFFFDIRMRPAWTEYYTGPGILTGHERKGPRPWTGFFVGLQSIVVFLFFHTTTTIFRPPLEEGLSYILKQMRGGKGGTRVT
jgi:hypothetical protein